MIAAPAPPRTESAPVQATSSPEVDLASPIHVLLVEDNQEHADWIAFLLSQDSLGRFDVEWASGLVEAMIRLSKPNVDVILLDLGMPELEGHRSYAAIRATAPEVPVVVLTSDENPISRELVLCSGAKDYILKNTVAAGQLQDALRRAFLNRTTRSGLA